jgi:hypothetical protein
VQYVFAVTAGFAAGRPPINSDENPAVEFCFVFELPDELTPRCVADGFGEVFVADHVLHSECFHADRLVLTNQPGSQLMKMILTGILDAGVQAGYPLLLLSISFTAFREFTQLPLRTGKTIRILMGESGISNLLTGTQSEERCKADIHTNHRINRWEWFEWGFEDQGSMVPAGSIKCHRDTRNRHAFGEGSGPPDFQWVVHLRENQLIPVQCEGVARVLRALLLTPFLESRVTTLLIEEPLERPIEVAEGLLQVHAAGFVHPLKPTRFL